MYFDLEPFILTENKINKPHKAEETGQNFVCNKYRDLDSISSKKYSSLQAYKMVKQSFFFFFWV